MLAKTEVELVKVAGELGEIKDELVETQLIEPRWFGKWAEFRSMSLIHAWKGHVPNSVHHITNAIIKHIELPNLSLQ